MTADVDVGKKREGIRLRLRSVESAAIAGVLYAVLATIALAVLDGFPDLSPMTP